MDSMVAQLLQQAVAARQQGRMVDAERLMAQALQRDPKEPQTLNLLGLTALERQDFEQAYRYFSAAAEVDPREAALWMNVASAARGLSDPSGEREALDHVLALDQRNLMAQIRLAQLQQRLGQKQDAAMSWSKVLSLTAGLSDIPESLTETLIQARQFVGDYQARFSQQVQNAVAKEVEVADLVTQRRFQACMDHQFQGRTIYRNECSGLYYPFLPADEFFDRDHFPWMKALEAKTDAIRAEFVRLMEQSGNIVRPYIRQEAGTPRNKWTALNGSLDWGAAFLWEYGERNEAVCAACPETVAALEDLPRADIPGKAPSAFFSLLQPGSHIPAHTGVTNTRTIVHLPLIVPPGCSFRVGGETRAWQEGTAFAFDDTIEHEAWNESEHLRVVLIFDVWNPHLSLAEQQLLKQFYATMDDGKTRDVATGI